MTFVLDISYLNPIYIVFKGQGYMSKFMVTGSRIQELSTCQHGQLFLAKA